MQRVDDALLGPLDRTPVELDALSAGDLPGRIELALAVDPHAAGANDLARRASRGDARVGEELGEAHELQP